MGSAAEAAYERLRKRLLSWPKVRERPEKKGTPLAEGTVKPTLRIGGGRLLMFVRDETRRLYGVLRVPDTLVDEVPEVEPGPDGAMVAWFDLARKREAARLDELARRVYRVHTGSEPPP